MFLFIGCTEQSRARSFGGTDVQNLPCGQKLETMTWKETHLWILTRPMKKNEEPETHTFNESSSWGLIQGTVVVKESACQPLILGTIQ